MMKNLNFFVQHYLETFNKRELITKPLFHLLLYQIKKNEYAQNIKINKIIKNIIDLKKNKQKQPNNNNKSFNKLPSSLIQSTATYLGTVSFMKFSRTNRWIAISLHKTPKPINQLKSSWINEYKSNYGGHFEQYQIKKLDQFKKVRKISINLSEIGAMHQWIWNNLDEFGATTGCF